MHHIYNLIQQKSFANPLPHTPKEFTFYNIELFVAINLVTSFLVFFEMSKKKKIK